MRAKIIADHWTDKHGEELGLLKIAEILSEPAGEKDSGKRIGVAVEHLYSTWIFLDKGPKSGSFIKRAITALEDINFNLKNIQDIGYNYREELEIIQEEDNTKLINRKDGEIWQSKPLEDHLQEVLESEINMAVKGADSYRKEFPEN